MPRLPTVAELAATPAYVVDHAGRRWRVVLDLWVDGVPAQQGSKRIGRAGPPRPNCRGCGQPPGKPILVDDNDAELSRWRGAVTSRALQAIGHRWRAAPIDGPVYLVLDFVMRRPSSAPKTYTPPAIRKPDGDKLQRAVWDALTEARVHADDARVVAWGGGKRLAELGEHPGVRVRECVPAADGPSE